MSLHADQAVEQIMATYKVYPEPSDDFFYCVRAQVVKHVDKLKQFGCIPKTYQQMGISPRISPVRYGDSINSTKKLVRHYGYSVAACVFQRFGYSIVDVDLRSAYVSVLLGLYPAELQGLHMTLKNTTLWDSIQQDFIKANLSSYYDKPSVKVCVYASLFGGGEKAMFESILENKRKAAGLTEREFKQDDMYESVYQLATVNTNFMLTHLVVKDFQDLSKELLKAYEGSWLQGPSGHQYQICEHSFRNVSFLVTFKALSLHC